MPREEFRIQRFHARDRHCMHQRHAENGGL